MVWKPVVTTANAGDPALPPPVVPVVRVSLSLSEKLYDQYAERAVKYGRTPEQEFELRLTALRDHTYITPICFNDEERAQLSHILGHTVSKPGELLARLASLMTLQVGDIKVEVPERIQLRLKTRVWRGQTLEGKVRKIVIEALEVECGLRPRG